ncbi:BnaCnng73090D [Brassica napus]|uniref:BnaCnng73090D protein n=1 Tax=Brassica napus TaxID=3708 RepID=A0A078JXP8_BRANA|nr:BnaCnng73090D [Brassica napus]
MKPPLKGHETRETPIREVYDTTTIPELLQLIDSILEELHRSLGITSVEANQSEKNQTSTDGPDPTDTKRLSEPFFLKNILLENSSGDTSELTTLAMSVHAVMLESGFVLINPVSSDDKFSFSKELIYTLPELVESVTVTFQSLTNKVVVYGSLSGNVRRVYLDKSRFMPVIDTLKSDEEVSSSIFKEIRCMASGNDLWKQKIWEEAKHLLLVGNGGRGSVNWKAKFASFWMHYKQKLSPVVQQHERETLTDIDMAMRMHHTCRFPIVSDPVPDPFGLSNGDDLHGSLGVHRGRQRLGRHRFSPGCNLGGGILVYNCRS